VTWFEKLTESEVAVKEDEFLPFEKQGMREEERVW
jgi:hypothetical protein